MARRAGEGTVESCGAWRVCLGNPNKFVLSLCLTPASTMLSGISRRAER